MRRTPTLRGQLGLLFVALAVPLLMLQLWWSYHDYRGAREQAWDDALAFADAVDLVVQQFVDQSGQLLQASAARMGNDWMASGDCAEDMQTLQNVLPFENVLLVTNSGTIVCSAAGISEGASANTWPWFPDWDGTFVMAPAVGSDFTGSWIIPLVAPVVDEDGEVLGALVGTIPLLELSGLLDVRPGEERLTTVADERGIVVARSADAERWIGRPLPPPSGSDRLVAPGRWVADGPDLTGIPRTWGQVLTDVGWIVYVGVPDSVVFGPALAEALWHVGGTLGTVLLAVLLGAWYYTRIAGSLRQLAARTRSIESGEVIPVPTGTPEEVAEVIEQLNLTLEARSRAESAEQAARDRFASLFDNAVFGVAISTPDGRFLQVNRAFADMLGYESEEALLAAGPEVLYPHPDDRANAVRRVIATGPRDIAPQEMELVRADGSPIIVRVGGRVREGPHGDLVFEGIIQDVTEEKRREDQLHQTQKMEAIGQLAGGVAHDFNNLLTVISGNVELLEDNLDENNPLRADLRQIAKATKRASSLTRRLLTFSRPGREGVATVDVNEVVPELCKMLTPLLGERITLRHDVEEDATPVSIDQGELEQVIVNLVLNARDAISDRGEIVISATTESQEVDDRLRPGVTVSVKDDGVGMDAMTLQRMFEPFFTTKATGEGTGLGLSSVYGILQRVDGRIDVDSEPGRGTEIRAWLPSVSDAAEEKVASSGLARSTARQVILVVEDDELVRAFVGRALTTCGFEVRLTAGGEEALDCVRQADTSVDLVLTDVVMPGMNGPKLAEALSQEAPGTPVLFMSGYIENEFFDRELDHHPDALLRKPFTVEELHTRVQQALDYRRDGVRTL